MTELPPSLLEEIDFQILKIEDTYRGEGGSLTRSHNTDIFCNNIKIKVKFSHYNKILIKD